MKRIVVLVLGGFVALVLLFEAVLAAFQPLPRGAVKVRTFDRNGEAVETVVQLWQGETGTLWLESGHYFRGWYNRALTNPEVEIVDGSQIRSYRAVPDNSPEALAEVKSIKRSINGRVLDFFYWVQKGFAPMKPVRLEGSFVRRQDESGVE